MCENESNDLNYEILKYEEKIKYDKMFEWHKMKRDTEIKEEMNFYYPNRQGDQIARRRSGKTISGELFKRIMIDQLTNTPYAEHLYDRGIN